MADVLWWAIAGGLLLVLLLQGLLLMRQQGRAADAQRVEQALAQLDKGLARLERELREELSRGRRDDAELAFREREERSASSHQLARSIGEQVGQFGRAQTERLSYFAQELQRFSEGLDARFENLKMTVDSRLTAIQSDNASKLDAMRQTVDEKLHATLEQRLGESFKLVSDRLEQVHRGLGEMQHLAAGVGDLKRVLSNVKTRGTWGEIQLSALLEQLLTVEQFAANVPTRPGSAERVDFAVRLPGRDDSAVVWLPIDAKFPIEDYQRLMDAQDAIAAEAAGKSVELRIRAEARSIRDKYIAPPHTTDFAVLYLPIEGLYAEALRRPGLAEQLQRDFRVTLAGPTTLAALLNSLQMGFRTLAIEQRSAEVWAVLGAVKTEFGKFGEALAHTRKKLDEASSSIGRAETRTRQLGRKLKDVEALPVAEAERLMGMVANDEIEN